MNAALVAGRVNKLAIHRGLAHSKAEVLLRIGLNTVRCGNGNWVAPAGAQRWRSGDCRSPISVAGEENSSRQHTRFSDSGRTSGGNSKRSRQANSEAHAVSGGNLWSK